MTQHIVLIRGPDDILRAALKELEDESKAVKLEDTADLDTTPDCCCTCEDFPECLHCVDSTVDYIASDDDVEWPTDITAADVLCIGRPGQGGDSLDDVEGAGGGGGGASARKNIFISGGAAMEVIVNDAANSYASELKQATVTMCKAVAGQDGDDSPDGLGGQGGQASACIGTFKYNGGDGEDGRDEFYGGGGGGGGGTTEEGVDGNLAEGGRGGEETGGAGGDESEDGNDYGGAGGGGYDNLVGGDNALGLVRINWWGKMHLSLQITGAPSYSYECPCPGPNCYFRRDIIWDALNTTFELIQDQAGSAVFYWRADNGDAEPDCEALTRDDLIFMGAVLVETDAGGTAGPPEDNFIEDENEIYVTQIRVDLECVDGEMRIQAIEFWCCNTHRHRTIVGGSFPDFEYEWGPWETTAIVPCQIQDCGIGEQLEVVQPCDILHSMKCEVEWPEPLFDGTGCTLDFDCGSVTIGTLEVDLFCP